VKPITGVGIHDGGVAIDLRPAPSAMWDGVEVPLHGEELLAEELENRDLSPSGLSPQDWEAAWRKQHNRHYLMVVRALQEDRTDPKNVWAAHAALVGADFQRADLRGMNLDGVNLTNACFRGADLAKTSMRGAILVKADFSRASLYMADCTGADFSGADMSMSYQKGAVFTDTKMTRAHLRGAFCQEAFYVRTDMRYANVAGADFWGSAFDGANLEDVKNLRQALFYRWFDPETKDWAYEPREGWKRVDRNFTGRMTYRGNAGRTW